MSIEIDFAQNKEIPKLAVNQNFYLRNLWFYLFNLHIYDHKSLMYYLIEGEHQKGANTVVSYLYDALKNLDLTKYKKIVIFSDSCCAQNKNYLIMKFLSLMAIEFGKEIMQIFPVVGHSYSICDRNFANFTKKLKKIQTIEHYSEYLNILKELRFDILKSKIFNWKSIFQMDNSNSQIQISKCVQISYKSDGTIMTFHEYEKQHKIFEVIQNKLINWQSHLSEDKSHFVSNEKIQDVKKLFKYLKPENQKFLNNHFEKYNLKNFKM